VFPEARVLKHNLQPSREQYTTWWNIFVIYFKFPTDILALLSTDASKDS
jgi:hypothetical protein